MHQVSDALSDQCGAISARQVGVCGILYALKMLVYTHLKRRAEAEKNESITSEMCHDLKQKLLFQ